MDPDTDKAICSITLPEGEPPEWIKLMPLGEIDTADGRHFVLRDAAAVVEASGAKIELVVDYEHQTDFSEDNGQPAPAAGWMKALEVRDDGIWARVEWTDRAAAHLRAKEYRYLSPTFLADKKTGVVRKILRAALTNAPAIHDLPALAKEGDTQMEELLKALAALLGLPEDADQAAITAKIQEIAAEAESGATALASIRKALKLGDDADEGAIVTALTKVGQAGTPDPAKYVKAEDVAAEVATLKAEIAALKDDTAADKATAAVEKAIADGKLIPALKDWALDLAKTNADGFRSYLDKAPALAKGQTVPTGQPKTGDGPLDGDALAVCKAMGHNPEDFKKVLNEQEADH